MCSFVMRNTKGLILTMQELTAIPDEVFADAKRAEISTVDLCKNRFKEIPEE